MTAENRTCRHRRSERLARRRNVAYMQTVGTVRRCLGRLVALFLIGGGIAGYCQELAPATFDDLALDPESAYTVPDGVSAFRSGDFLFAGSGNSAWSYWEGFTYSNRTDTGTHGLDGQYTAYAGHGNDGHGTDGSSVYGVGYMGFAGTLPRITTASGDAAVISGLYVANSAYTYHVLAEGDAFAKKVGGADGTDPDWLRLTAFALDAAGERTGATREFMLADFRYPSSSRDYIVGDWTWFSLAPLGAVYGVEFELSSSDTGDWGMNTPAYFAVDSVNAVPPAVVEPPPPVPATFDDLALDPESAYTVPDGVSAFRSGDFLFAGSGNSAWSYWEGFTYSNRTDTGTHGLDGQYTAYAGHDNDGHGTDGSSVYGVGYMGFAGTLPRITPASGDAAVISGLYVANSAYTYHVLAEGDAFAKKFGGADGTDPDWLRLTAFALDAAGERTGATREFMLADFRYPSSSRDYIVGDWAWFSLAPLGAVYGVEFELSSSDTGEWGMNTPAYFAVDSVNAVPPAVVEPPPPVPATFDDLALDPESAYTVPDGVSAFRSGDFLFAGSGNSAWSYWEGFTYSNRTDTGTHGLDGQYTAYAGHDNDGHGTDGSSAYGVGYMGFAGTLPRITTASGDAAVISGLYVANSAYTYHVLAEGDAFAKKFGGADGTDPDWLRLTAEGVRADGSRTGVLHFYLADFRFVESEFDYIVDDWRWFDLSCLGPVVSVELTVSSSDVGPWGMNTPAYFAVDGVNSVPPPAAHWFPRLCTERFVVASGEPAGRYRLTILRNAARQDSQVLSVEFDDDDREDGYVFAEPEIYLGAQAALVPGEYTALWEAYEPADHVLVEFAESNEVVPGYGCPLRIDDAGVEVGAGEGAAAAAVLSFTPANAMGHGVILQRESAGGWTTVGVHSAIYARADSRLPFPVNAPQRVPLGVNEAGQYRVSVRGINPVAPWQGERDEIARALVEGEAALRTADILYSPWVAFTLTDSAPPEPVVPVDLVATVLHTEDGATARLQWGGSAGLYVLHMTDENGVPVIDRGSVAGNQHTVDGPLAPGRYYWTVSAQANGLRSDWAPYAEFLIASSVLDPDAVPGAPTSLVPIVSDAGVVFDVTPEPSLPGVSVQFQVVIGGSTDSLSFSSPWPAATRSGALSIPAPGGEYSRSGVDYFVRARATNAAGDAGPWSPYVHYRGIGGGQAVAIESVAPASGVGLLLTVTGAAVGETLEFQVYHGDSYAILGGEAVADEGGAVAIEHSAAAPVADATTSYYQVRVRHEEDNGAWSGWVRYEVE